jgi:hypothetical protein
LIPAFGATGALFISWRDALKLRSSAYQEAFSIGGISLLWDHLKKLSAKYKIHKSSIQTTSLETKLVKMILPINKCVFEELK